MTAKETSISPAVFSNILKLVAKWGLAFVLMAFLVRSGKLSLDHVSLFFKSPFLAAACVAGISLTVCGTFFRWQILLRSLGFQITYFEALRLGMMGLFFSTVIPGTVGGDLVKAVYVAKKYPSAKSRAVSSIIIDRISGLLAVFLLGGMAYIIGHAHIRASESIAAQRVDQLGMLLSIGATFLLLALLAYPFVASKLPSQLPNFFKKIPGHHIWNDLYRVGLDFRNNPFVLWKVVILSVLLSGINFLVMALIAYTIYGPAPWGQLQPTSFVFAAVLGVCAMSLPLTPMGLGVGQMAFSAVFLAVGASTAEFGSSVITNNHIIQLFIGLIGMIFFLSYRHEAKKTS